MQMWISSSDCELCCDPSCCAHQSMSPASSRLYLLPLLLPFVLLLPFHAGCAPVILPVLALPFLGLGTSLPVFSFAFAVSPAVPIALAYVPSFACVFACLAAFLNLPRPTICPAVVWFVIRATSAVVLNFTTVPACSLLSFAFAFSCTFPETAAPWRICHLG